MSDDAPLGQDDIDQLVKQAQAGVASSGAGTATKSATKSAPTRPAKQESSAGDDIQLLLDQAEQALASVDEPISAALDGLQAFELKDFSGAPASKDKATLDLLRDVELDLKIELGRTHMYLEDVLRLRKGSVVSLDKLAGDPVDIYVNGRMVARGEVLVLNDNFCVRVAELMSGDDA